MRFLTLALVIPDEEALWAARDTAALIQIVWGRTGRAVVCRWPSTAPAGGMTLWKRTQGNSSHTQHKKVHEAVGQRMFPLLCLIITPLWPIITQLHWQHAWTRHFLGHELFLNFQKSCLCYKKATKQPLQWREVNGGLVLLHKSLIATAELMHQNWLKDDSSYHCKGVHLTMVEACASGPDRCQFSLLLLLSCGLFTVSCFFTIGIPLSRAFS